MIDADLAAVRRWAEGIAPTAEPVLAGSLAFDEPWAGRDGDGWQIESDIDLYLLVPRLPAALRLARHLAGRDLQAELGTRMAVDPYVIWRPLLERGLVGMVGRFLDSGAFVPCRLDRHALWVNQARKALLRWHLLAPRETRDRARYQRVKAVVEALRASILRAEPAVDTQALFSLRANREWLAAGHGGFDDDVRVGLQALLDARLDPEGPGPTDAMLDALSAWLETFATTAATSATPRRLGTTTARAWLSWLAHGLLPDPRVDYDRALIDLLADPLTPRLAADPSALPALDARWQHLVLAPWRPRKPEALARAVDGALRSPISTKGEGYLLPRRGGR